MEKEKIDEIQEEKKVEDQEQKVKEEKPVEKIEVAKVEDQEQKVKEEKPNKELLNKIDSLEKQVKDLSESLSKIQLVQTKTEKEKEDEKYFKDI